MTKKLVFGVGINDAGYAVTQRVNGKQVICSFYRSWVSMLQRCYSKKRLAMFPTYIGCSVCDEWLTFSNFKSWMEKQDWIGKQLDKDLLVKGNKVYSPDTCVFVDGATNRFTTDSGATRGEWPTGVSVHKASGKFRARCRNPFSKKDECLGYFTCPEQAHLAWKKRKRELTLQLACKQADSQLAEALRSMYL